MISDHFTVGSVYWATPVLDGRPKRIVIAIGRDAGVVQLAFVDTLTEAKIMTDGFFGKEFVRMHDGEADYNCSSSCEIDAARAASVYESIHRRCRDVH